MKLQLTRMHRIYGRKPGYRCGDCSNLTVYEYRGRNYRKCTRYGVSSSETSDWANRWEACGAFNLPMPEGEVPVKDWRHCRERVADVVEGQEKMF